MTAIFTALAVPDVPAKWVRLIPLWLSVDEIYSQIASTASTVMVGFQD